MNRQEMLNLLEKFSPIDVAIIKWTSFKLDEDNVDDYGFSCDKCSLCEVLEEDCEECFLDCKKSESDFFEFCSFKNENQFKEARKSQLKIVQAMETFKRNNPTHVLCKVKEDLNGYEVSVDIMKNEIKMLDEMKNLLIGDMSFKPKNDGILVDDFVDFINELGETLFEEIKKYEEIYIPF